MPPVSLAAPAGHAVGAVAASGAHRAQAKEGGTLTVGLAEEPDVLDPTFARTFVGRMVFLYTCEKLYDLDKSLTIVPQLAASLPAAAPRPLDRSVALQMSTMPLSCMDHPQPRPTPVQYIWESTYTPVADYEDREEPCTLFVKWGGELYRTEVDHSPLDVVAWHGNYAPYKYDLRRFSPVGALLFDHPDPSIFTCLTSPSETHGTANIDFVLFPERWSVAENTFRPPWYHRNIMSEFMGLVYGVYDAKPEGFVPGGMSLHNMMLPHGPDSDAFRHASQAELKPVKLTNTLAFMFESRFRQRVTKYAATSETRQDDYIDCWSGLKKHFDPDRRDPV